MAKDSAIILVGILAALVPFSGFPGAWKTVLIVVFGLSAAFIAFLLRAERLEQFTLSSSKDESPLPSDPLEDEDDDEA